MHCTVRLSILFYSLHVFHTILILFSKIPFRVMFLECVYCTILYCIESINHGMIYASPIPSQILYYMPFQFNSIPFHSLLKRSDKRRFHRKTSLTLQNSINQTILHSLMGLQILDTLHILSNNLQRLLTPSRN